MFNVLSGIEFEERELPPMSELLVNSYEYREYLRSRKVPDDYPVMVQLHEERSWKNRPSVIIPFTYDNVIVGHTQRFLDNRTPKYISNSQPGYVFGTDLQHKDWAHAIVVEGIFDALCISGLAVMHSTVSDEQARLIRSLGREITVVPDQDLAGMELVDRAVGLGWAVSMPPWPADIKDVNDSVMRYGRLATMLTIFENRETSRIKIELRKKNLVKRLRS
jgi:DNA primase